MGNCFGKESSSSSSTPSHSAPIRRNNFSSPGRTLGGSGNPPKPATASVPATDNSGYENGPVATLAGGFGAPSTHPPNSQTPLLQHQQQGGGDAKSAAAKAAEERAAKAAQSGHGALEQKLAAQRKQNALQQAAAENLRTREIDSTAEARAYN